MATTAKIFRNGNSQAVRLPRAFRLPGTEAAIWRDGERIILEPLVRSRWPKDFFRKIRIADPKFGRPPQGDMPASVDF